MVTQHSRMTVRPFFGVSVMTAATLTIWAGCATEEGRPPIARIDVTPGSIPENDGFQTAVVLDGTRSADPVDDPDGSASLEFLWSVEGDEVRFEAGSRDTDEAPTVRFRGD